jgi:hypothetical protein
MLQKNAKFTDERRPANWRESREAAPKEAEGINRIAHGKAREKEKQPAAAFLHRCGL